MLNFFMVNTYKSMYFGIKIAINTEYGKSITHIIIHRRMIVRFFKPKKFVKSLELFYTVLYILI